MVTESSPPTGLVEIAADPGYDLHVHGVKKFAPIKCGTNRCISSRRLLNNSMLQRLRLQNPNKEFQFQKYIIG